MFFCLFAVTDSHSPYFSCELGRLCSFSTKTERVIFVFYLPDCLVGSVVNFQLQNDAVSTFIHFRIE